MRRLPLLFLLAQAIITGQVHAADKTVSVLVTEPYIEMHSGPGRGFPVVYVVGRGESVEILFSRTDWFRVRAPRGEEGWVRREELAKTVLASGEPAPIAPYPDFASHRWEMGLAYGIYNHQNLVSVYGDFALTESIDTELVLQEALGTIDNRSIATIGLRHTFVPEWKWVSPTVGIGTGIQYIQKSTPPQPPQRTNELAYVSYGARGFITEKFMWRIDLRRYVAFTNQNENKEPREWKFALAVFF